MDIREINMNTEILCFQITKNYLEVNLLINFFDVSGNFITNFKMFTNQQLDKYTICVSDLMNLNIRGLKILFSIDGNSNQDSIRDFQIRSYTQKVSIKVNQLRKQNQDNWYDDWQEISLIGSTFWYQDNSIKFSGKFLQSR